MTLLYAGGAMSVSHDDGVADAVATESCSAQGRRQFIGGLPQVDGSAMEGHTMAPCKHRDYVGQQYRPPMLI